MDTNVQIDISNRKKVTLCNHNYSKEGILHPDRVMSEYDLLYMQKGTWDIYEDDKCYHLKDHTLLLLEPNKHHFSKVPCSPEMHNIYVHFSVDTPADFSTSIALPKIMDCTSFPSIEKNIEKIISIYWSDANSEKKNLCSSIILDYLLVEISELYKKNSEQNDFLISSILQDFLSCPDKFFSPAELANNYNLSIRTLSGHFKKATGLSIHQYQQKMKLDMAYDEIPLYPGRTMRDIALSYGFYDEFHFSKLFKKQFGISPSNRR